MSHSTVLVVGSNPEQQLAPFDESERVEAYDEPCFCIGRQARHDARQRVDKEYTTIEALRTSYQAIEPTKRPAWKDHIKKYNELEEKYDKEHPEHGKPDPKCEDCKGSGKRETTYNPDSKWDWYSLGGRWAGYWKLKESAKKRYHGTEFLGRPGVGDNKPLFDVDMAKKADIDFAGMRKIRKAQAEARWDKLHADLKSPDEKVRKRAEFRVMDVGSMTRKQYAKECMDVATFAVLMDGEWYERGHMGWWGMVRNEKANDAWQKEFDKLIKGLPGHTWLSIYDVHI